MGADVFDKYPVCFFLSTKQSIFGVIHHLHLRRQTAKLQLYERFRMVLAASVVFAILWAVYGVVRSTERETVRRAHSSAFLSDLWFVYVKLRLYLVS